MFKYIKIAQEIKKDVEAIPCKDCRQANLSFKGVEFDGDYKEREVKNLVVDAFCKTCRRDSTVVIHITE